MHSFFGFSALACACALMLAASSPASAVTPAEMESFLKKYGFEYRDGERPYGLPIKAKLTRVRVADNTYEIDRASPLTRKQVDDAIRTYLRKHAANELMVIGALVGAPMGRVRIDAGKAFIRELRTDLIKPPLESWRAQVESFKYKGATIDAHCDFNFVKLDGKYFQLYFEDRGSYKTSHEPGCDVRSSNYRHTN